MVRPGDLPFGDFDAARTADTVCTPPSTARTAEDSALISHALDVSTLKLAVLEIFKDDLQLISCTPAFAGFFSLTPERATGSNIHELEIDRDFEKLWLDSSHETWLLEASVSFHYLDHSTHPPRRLLLTLTPLLDRHEPNRLVSCQIEERSMRSTTSLPSSGIPDAGHVLDNAPSPIWTCGADGERDYVNSQWLRFTGRSPQQELGQGWLDVVHPEDVEDYRESFLNAFHGHELLRHEFRLQRHDGEYRSMLDVGRPRWRSDGAFLGFVGSLTDITELRRTEARHRHSERWHRELIEGTDNLVLQLDGQGFVAFVNPICRHILGVEPEECVGFPLLDFVDDDDRDRVSRLLEQWLTGKTLDAPVELRLRSRGSEIHDMLWTVNAHGSSPESMTINCIGQDITERKRAERVRRIQSQVLESMIEGVMLTNPSGIILYTNPAQNEMFGYASGELIGQSYTVLGGAPVHTSTHSMQKTMRDQGVFVGESTHRNKDGSAFHTISRIKRIEIDGADHWIAVIEDITDRKRDELDRKRLDRRIQQAQKLESLGVLAGGIAHDFNNLLMVMLGNASLALQDLSVEQSAYADVEQIEAAAMRAADLTKQMLAYSGRGQFMVEPIDLSAEVGEMGHLLANSVAKGIEIDYLLGGELPKVECDVSQIRQVVINLTINASEAIGNNSGRIVLRTGSKHCSRALLDETFLADELPEGTYAFLQIEDNGCGMDASTLSKIFDPFFTTKFTGRGLGLAAVLGIVRGHRGGIKIDSREDRGSTFTVYLPAAEPAIEPEVSGTQSSSGLSGEGTVLLVDDDDSVRQMASRMLEKLGFEVIPASSGLEALELFRLHQSSLCAVLLDMTMPKMDGEETFRHLQKISPRVPVVLSSGYSEQIAVERFEGQSPAGFLQKPYRQTDLILKMDEVLDLRR